MSDLTICSVNFRSADCLRLNIELTVRLNAGEDWRWVVVDNEPPASAGLQLPEPERVSVIPGALPDMTKPPKCRGSYHHAAALVEAIQHVHTRFVLFLDPDFYLVRPRWMAELLGHMVERDLSFFGAPWHPKWYIKYRRFPCMHCLFVDLTRVPAGSLDFSPQYDLSQPERADTPRSFMRSLKRHIPAAIKRPLAALVRRTLSPWGQRARLIGSSRDTGYGIYARHMHSATLHECVTPVFRPEVEFRGPPRELTMPWRLLAAVLPDRLCYIPKRRDSFTRVGFREHGCFDAASRNWEEFMWQGRPFGFHIRRNAQDGARESDLPVLRQAIAEFGEGGPASEVGGDLLRPPGKGGEL